eukprot:gene56636-75631_t
MLLDLIFVAIWLLDMRFTTHMILGGVMSFFLGVVLFLLVGMDRPMRGSVSVTPQAFQVHRSRLTVVAAALLALAMDGMATAGDREMIFFSVGTGSSSGAYYATGRALCEVVNRDVGKDGYRCSAEATPGS